MDGSAAYPESGKWATFCQNFDIDSVIYEFSFLSCLVDLGFCELGEAPELGDFYSLPARKLHLASSESFLCMNHILLLDPQRINLLPNLYPCDLSIRLPIGMSHTRLQPISPCTAQHFVYPSNMPGMNSTS